MNLTTQLDLVGYISTKPCPHCANNSFHAAQLPGFGFDGKPQYTISTRLSQCTICNRRVELIHDGARRDWEVKKISRSMFPNKTNKGG